MAEPEVLSDFADQKLQILQL